jgi:hypothetical protein
MNLSLPNTHYLLCVMLKALLIAKKAYNPIHNFTPLVGAKLQKNRESYNISTI